jgi:hypothetical protein
LEKKYKEEAEEEELIEDGKCDSTLININIRIIINKISKLILN